MKYEARLEDGTLVAKSDGVEFIIKEGQSFEDSNVLHFIFIDFGI